LERREAFKQQQWGLRWFPPSQSRVKFQKADVEGFDWIWNRHSERQFTLEKVPAHELSALLCVLSFRREKSGGIRYAYGSAGGLYPLQTYVAVKAGRVEGLACGTYYYDPGSHELV